MVAMMRHDHKSAEIAENSYKMNAIFAAAEIPRPFNAFATALFQSVVEANM